MRAKIWGWVLMCFSAGALVAQPCCDTSSCGASCWWDNISVGADWLYWKAEQSEMELGASVTSNAAGTSVVSDLVLPQFEYTSNYRVYVDYLCNPCWSVGLSLTHVSTNPSSSIHKDPAAIATDYLTFNPTLYPVLSGYSGVNFSNYDARWNLDLYYLDGIIRRPWCLCPCFTLEPFAGVRGFWMKQKYSIDASATGEFVTVRLKERFCGGGLIGGVNGSWEWGCGLSLFGQFGASLIYSGIEVDNTVIGSIVDIENDYHAHKSLPTLDSAVGLRYCFSLCSCESELHIGWENHLFFHTNQATLTADGNLTMQGLTLGGSFCF